MLEVLAGIRDVVIILLAFFALIANVALALVAFKLWVLVKELRAEITPIMQSVGSTASTVRGTATLVGDVVVGPLARLAGLAAGITTFVRALLTLSRGGGKRRGGRRG